MKLARLCEIFYATLIIGASYTGSITYEAAVGAVGLLVVAEVLGAAVGDVRDSLNVAAYAMLQEEGGEDEQEPI